MSDRQTILAGTATNAAGLVAGVGAALGVQVLLGRELPEGGLGLVTVAVQVAFVAAAGGRVGMDLAALRSVAIGAGAGDLTRVRSLADRCALVGLGGGVAMAALVALAASATGDHARTIAIGAAAIPPAAAANVYLGATRGLKTMRPTLLVFWIGQPVLWIALAALALALGGGAGAAVAAYGGSWLLALVAARLLWRRLTAGLGDAPARREDVRAALAFGAPRAPSGLLAHLLFWADVFVLARYAGPGELDAYAAAARVSQVVLLFLTSVNLILSPFAADLHARGRREELGALFENATRWALAATLPLVVVLSVAAGDVLEAFGPAFDRGADPLRILLAGQALNVATGSVAFILIMAGYTGLDLADNALATALLVGLAAPLAAAEGAVGTAVAAAVAISAVNAVRLLQVRRRLGIHPYSRAYARLVLPLLGCAAAALAAHAATGDGPWWAALAATAGAGLLAYAALLPAGLPPAERAVLAGYAARIANRPSRRGSATGSR